MKGRAKKHKQAKGERRQVNEGVSATICDEDCKYRRTNYWYIYRMDFLSSNS